MSMEINDLRMQMLIDRLSTSSDEALCRNHILKSILDLYTMHRTHYPYSLVKIQTDKINRLLQNRQDTYKHYTTHYVQTHLSNIFHSNAIEKLFIPSHEKYHFHVYIVKFARSILCIIFHYLYISHTLAYGVTKKFYI